MALIQSGLLFGSCFIFFLDFLGHVTLGSRGYFFFDTDRSRRSRVNEARSAERKKNLWSKELRVSFPCNFRIIYLIKPVWRWCTCFFSLTLTAEIWSYVTLHDSWKKNCAKAYLERKVLFQKIHTSSFKYMKRTEVSWEVHTLYVFWSQQDKKNFRFATPVLLYQVKLNIARQNCYAKHVLYFSANKPRRKLSGITKKRKTFCIQGTIRENAEPETSKTKHTRKSSHSFKVRSLVGKIQTKLLPRATLIQLSNVRLNYFEVYPEIALPHFQKTPNNNSGLYCLFWTSQLPPVLNLMWRSFSMQPIKFNVTALIPCGRGSNQSTTQFKFWTDF